MANALESDFIGVGKEIGADFKGLYERLQTVAKTLPPSHIPSSLDALPIVGALVAFIEHGDAIFTAAEHGSLHVLATLGHQDVNQVEQTIGADIRNELSAVLAKASAAGIDLGVKQAPPAPTAAPSAPGSQPQLTPAQEDEIQAIIDGGKTPPAGEPAPSNPSPKL